MFSARSATVKISEGAGIRPLGPTNQYYKAAKPHWRSFAAFSLILFGKCDYSG